MSRTGSEGKFKAIAVSTFMVTLLGTMFSVFAIVPNGSLQYVTFVLSAIHRAFVFGNNAAMLAMIFPMEYFGKLFGISQVQK